MVERADGAERAWSPGVIRALVRRAHVVSYRRGRRGVPPVVRALALGLLRCLDDARGRGLARAARHLQLRLEPPQTARLCGLDPRRKMAAFTKDGELRALRAKLAPGRSVALREILYERVRGGTCLCCRGSHFRAWVRDAIGAKLSPRTAQVLQRALEGALTRALMLGQRVAEITSGRRILRGTDVVAACEVLYSGRAWVLQGLRREAAYGAATRAPTPLSSVPRA
jgi:hypothetical protein